MKSRLLLALAVGVSACASSRTNANTSYGTASAAVPRQDPRIGLKAGWMNAGQAAWNMRLVSTTAPSADFINPASPGDFRFINSDLSFRGTYVIQGNFNGVQIWDITNPKLPTLYKAFVCPGRRTPCRASGVSGS